MNLVSIDGVSKNVKEVPLFTDVSFGIDSGEHIGFVGPNGCGKSTFLRLLLGTLEPDSGTIAKSRALTVSFLEQRPQFEKDDTLRTFLYRDSNPLIHLVHTYSDCLNRVAAAQKQNAALEKTLATLTHQMEESGGFTVEHTYESLLSELGLCTNGCGLDAPMHTMSGGMVKKAAIARAFCANGALLLLDEPTNHLDIDTIEWMEKRLLQYGGAFVLVTHDRYFLDAVCNRMLDIDRGKISKYEGNFSTYLRRKKERAEEEARHDAKREAILAVELEWLKRGPKARSLKDSHRKARALELLSERSEQKRQMEAFSAQSHRMGGKVLNVKDVYKTWGAVDESEDASADENASNAHGDITNKNASNARAKASDNADASNTPRDASGAHVESAPHDASQSTTTPLAPHDTSLSVDASPVIKPFSYEFTAGERIGIIGPNGSGKSTFLDLIAGRTAVSGGAIERGVNTVFAYFDQNARFVNRELTVLEYMRSVSEHVKQKDGTTCSIEQFLEKFLFPREMFNQKISYLSGGELRRLQLIQLLASAPNFLLFDEPTNDFDIETISVLENFLNDFDGCILTVSHDRAFLDNVTDFLFVFDGEGNISYFSGGYADYREYIKAKDEAPPDSTQKEREPERTETPLQTKPTKKRRLTYKESQEFSHLLDDISALEDEKAALESFFASGDFARASEHSKQNRQRYEELSTLIEEKTLRWEELAPFADN